MGSPGSLPATTVVVPNFNSGDLLRLCLASLLGPEAPRELRVIVVDNDSTDVSRAVADRAAARGLVTLVRRDGCRNDGAGAHGAALDAGLARVETPFVFTLDSDAWARRPDWLARYHAALEGTPGAACAGATKFEDGPRLLRRALAWLRGEPIASRPEYRYVRPCHALYRTDLIRQHGLSFAPALGPDGVQRTTGEHLFHGLRGHGHAAAILRHDEVAALIGHVRHASVVLNPGRFPSLRERARRRGVARIQKLLASPEAREIIARAEI